MDVSVRLLALALLLLPSSTSADRGSYRLLDVKLEPLVAARELGIHVHHQSESQAPSWRQEGSAGELRGLVCVEHIFVNDPDSSWTESHRRRVRQIAGEALAHLRGEAEERGIELVWKERERSHTSVDEVSISIDEHAWTSAALGSAPVEKGVYLPIPACEAKTCEQRMAILHVLKAGRSYALPSVINRDQKMERVVMFMRRRHLKSGLSVDEEQASILVPEYPASYVHEILHLFGAQDLYKPEARRLAAAIRYPDEVMLRSSRPLSSVDVSAYTAYYVGWSDDEPAELPYWE
jgi:hypothetical protein